MPTSIPAENIDRLSDRAVLVLPAVYILPQAVASDLERFVRKGGHLLIIDGPVKSMGKGGAEQGERVRLL